ncbi:hypothetical protein LIER_19763 [Lithospermum erythrorhizon]|uniref:Retrotransposon Copia-like N-terminal domain-containing protein n=1 Tax=Lithospermum erythrorhizon TaxID=34254 RepID=A0AAV3QLI3_LITER
MAEVQQNQAANAQNQVESSEIKTDNPLYLHSSDHSSLVLVSEVLTESNYISWSRAMMIALEVRDKLCFVNGEIETPAIDHVTYKQWRKVNSTLISSMMNAMSRDIGRDFMFSDNARDLWNEIKERFGGSNGPRVFELRRSIYTPKQGGDTVHIFFNKIKRLWDELVVLKPETTVVNNEEMMM